MRRIVRTLLVACSSSAALVCAASTSFADQDTWFNGAPAASTAPAPAPASPAAPPAAADPAPARPKTSASLSASFVSTQEAPPPRDEPAPDPDKTAQPVNPNDEVLLHGFRLGYGYVMNYDRPLAIFADNPSDPGTYKSLAEKTGMRSPQQFLIGYEFVYRATGRSWLNVILVANATIGGLEQSKFFPTANGLIGFEFDKSFQIGVGPSLAPLKGQESHVIVAAGWTPRVGRFYVPVHAFYVPDVDGLNRMGMTTGVTW